MTFHQLGLKGAPKTVPKKMFPTIVEINAQLHQFGILLRQDPNSDQILVDGWIDWRATRAGCASSQFDTRGHFWAEWTWYVAWALENHRKNKLFIDFFLSANDENRVEILSYLKEHFSQENRKITEIIEGVEFTVDNIPTDWASRLKSALEQPNSGAAFHYSHLYRIARDITPAVMHAYFNKKSA